MNTPTPLLRPARARLSAVAVIGLALGLGVVVTDPAPAIVVAETPPPRDPVVLYQEGFESGNGNHLTTYVAASGATYTAAPEWLDDTACNGFISTYSAVTRPPTYCTQSPVPDFSYINLRLKAKAIGELRGVSNSDENHVLASETAAALEMPPNGIQFATTTPLSIPASQGRFVTFSVDAAATACHAAAPLLRFYVVDGGGVETAVSDSAINPCTDPRTRAVYVEGNAIWTGTYAADSSILHTGTTLGIVLRNEEPATAGNDGAIDNITVLDVTPQLFAQVTTTLDAMGEPAELVYTIVNTSELSGKSGWQFTNTLPAGLTVTAGGIHTTCPVTVTASEGSGVVQAVGGVLERGQETCEIRIPVTSPVAGTFSVDPGQIVGTGLDPSGSPAVFSFGPRTYTTSVVASTDRAHRGDDVDYTLTVANTGGIAYPEAVYSFDLSDVLDDATLVGDLPAGVSLVDGTLQATVTLGATTQWQLPVRVRVNDHSTGDDVLWAAAVVPGGTGGSCGSCTAVTTIPSYEASIATDKPMLPYDGTLTYTVTLHGSGTAPYEGSDPVVFTVDLTDVLDDATITGGLPLGATLDGGILTASVTLPVAGDRAMAVTVQRDGASGAARLLDGSALLGAESTRFAAAPAAGGNGQLVAVLHPLTAGGVCAGSCTTSATLQPQTTLEPPPNTTSPPGLTVLAGGIAMVDRSHQPWVLFGAAGLLLLTVTVGVAMRPRR